MIMEQMDIKYGKDDHEAYFDPQAYLRDCYTTGGKYWNTTSIGINQGLMKMFERDHESGGRFIDLGCGPTLFPSFLASRHYTSVTLAEFSERNRRELEKYVNEGGKGAFDWSSMCQVIADHEGCGLTADNIAERLRDRVDEIMPCDFLNVNPITPHQRDPYHCVVVSLVLEAACLDKDTYRRAVQNILTLVEPGGLIIQVGVLGQHFYHVGDVKFFSLALNMDFVKQCYLDTGCEVLVEVVDGLQGGEEQCDANGWFVVKIRKNAGVETGKSLSKPAKKSKLRSD